MKSGRGGGAPKQSVKIEAVVEWKLEKSSKIKIIKIKIQLIYEQVNEIKK